MDKGEAHCLKALVPGHIQSRVETNRNCQQEIHFDGDTKEYFLYEKEAGKRTFEGSSASTDTFSQEPVWKKEKK